MERKVRLAPGEYYHIYNRGVEKRVIFLDDSDKKRFIKLLYLANGTTPLVFKTVQGLPLDEVERGTRKLAVGAYVLMSNHFHILVKETQEGGITSFMEKLQTGYSMYFNKKNNRVGPLFQGTFKAEHINRDEHLKYLFAYIHLNPIKIIEPNWKEGGIKNIPLAESFLKKYTGSSYTEYIGGNREEKLIISSEEFPEYFSKLHNFKDFLKDWLHPEHL
jgi:putative transposase